MQNQLSGRRSFRTRCLATLCGTSPPPGNILRPRHLLPSLKEWFLQPWSRSFGANGHLPIASFLLSWFCKIEFRQQTYCSIGVAQVWAISTLQAGAGVDGAHHIQMSFLLENLKWSRYMARAWPVSHWGVTPLSYRRRVVVFDCKHSWNKERCHGLSCHVGVLGDLEGTKY